MENNDRRKVGHGNNCGSRTRSERTGYPWSQSKGCSIAIVEFGDPNRDEVSGRHNIAGLGRLKAPDWDKYKQGLLTFDNPPLRGSRLSDEVHNLVSGDHPRAHHPRTFQEHPESD